MSINLQESQEGTPAAALARHELPPEVLCVSMDTSHLPFASTAEIAVQKEVIGQERAVRSMDFALHAKNHGFNVYVSGIPGTGKKTIIRTMIGDVALNQATPDDWCYVNNFKDPDRPHALSLPAGKGREFQREVEKVVASLRVEFPRAFQSKDYEDRHQALQEMFSEGQARLSAELVAQAKTHDFLLKTTRVGFVVVPIYKGKNLDTDAFAALGPVEREEIQRKEKLVDEAIRVYRQQVRALQDDVNRQIDELNHSIAHYTSEQLFEGLRQGYQSYPRALAFVQSLQDDVLENFEGFLSPPDAPIDGAPAGSNFMTRYSVNLLVDNEDTRGAPIVEESNPTYTNLVGRIEKKSRFGFLYTDFTLIKAGAILKANGGYLVVAIIDILRNPFAWDALKRIVKRQEITIEDMAEMYGLVATSSVKPEPIPIRLRVVLVGNPMLYDFLHEFDEDFPYIFKVKADFDTDCALTTESAARYANFIAGLCQGEDLLHFDRTAIARVMHQAARWAEHQGKLSLHFSDVADLVREASYWAGVERQALVSGVHVQRAIAEKYYRSNLLEERIRELIVEGTLMLDVTGTKVGQVNGLSVYDLGDFAFGKPSRITARVFLGQDGVVNIEREAELSGKSHSKGVLILSGYLAGHYGRHAVMSLSATLTFEQSYGTVDGDSASVAELLALLSALTRIPVSQAIAVTGSINQWGEVQAVGGINEKIEGHFAVCKAMGLDKSQGVIMPKSNTRHLMLNDEVIAAVRSGDFHIYAVAHADEAVEILTGRVAGELLSDGSYPKGSFNAEVLERLADMEERVQPPRKPARRYQRQRWRRGRHEDDGEEW
jgi:lon-related putative ATP-dependent protease